MKELQNLLRSNAGVSAWRATETKTRSYELFFVHEKLETVRSTDTSQISVTVYVDHDGKRGDSTFKIYSSMSEETIAQKIEQAVKRAKLVGNEPYELPAGGEMIVELPNNLKNESPEELACRIAKAVFSAKAPEGCTINALEVFVYVDAFRVLNSEGVDKTQVTHHVMIEAIPTFTDSEESVELYEDYRFTEFDEEKLQKEISAKLLQAYDRRRAVKPDTPMTLNVLLRPQEIRELLSELIGDLNYASVYTHANLHKIRDDLQPGENCDKLTVTMRGITEGSERSAFFDEDGTTLADTVVLQDGVVQNYYGASRFGQYLGVQRPSGNLRCVGVGCGTLREKEIEAQPYLDCVSLSGLQVDLYNDYIGGEIRLAYYFDGEKVLPVTGISMSARLSEVLSSLRLSEKNVKDGSYEGPEKILMKNVNVL